MKKWHADTRPGAKEAAVLIQQIEGRDRCGVMQVTHAVVNNNMNVYTVFWHEWVNKETTDDAD